MSVVFGARRIEGQVQRLGDKARITKRDVEHVLRASQAVGRQEGALEDVVHSLCTAVLDYPALISVVSTVIGIMNASGPDAGEAALAMLGRTVEERIASDPERGSTLQLLRLLVDLENTCVLDPHSTARVLAALQQHMQDTIKPISRRCAHALLLAGCLPWVARDLSARLPEALDAACDALEEFTSGHLEGDPIAAAANVRLQVQQVLALRKREWQDHVVPRHYIHFVRLFERGKQHPLPSGVFGAGGGAVASGGEGMVTNGEDESKSTASNRRPERATNSRSNDDDDDDDDDDDGTDSDDAGARDRRPGRRSRSSTRSGSRTRSRTRSRSRSRDRDGRGGMRDSRRGSEHENDDGDDENRRRGRRRRRGRANDERRGWFGGERYSDDDKVAGHRRGRRHSRSRRSPTPSPPSAPAQPPPPPPLGTSILRNIVPSSTPHIIGTVPGVLLFPPVTTAERYLAAQLARPILLREEAHGTAATAASHLSALCARLQPLAARFCIMEVVFAEVLAAPLSQPPSHHRLLFLQNLVTSLFKQEDEFCDAFVVCLRFSILQGDALSMQQMDALVNCLSLVLCQSGFDLPWADIVGPTEDLSPPQHVLVVNLFESITCLAHATKLARKVPEGHHVLLPPKDTTATSIAATARGTPEVHAIVAALTADDSTDDHVHDALSAWTVASLGFNVLSEKLTQYPMDALPTAAFWLAILAHDDALEDVMRRCQRWKTVIASAGKRETSQEAGLHVIETLLSARFSAMASVVRFLLRENIYSTATIAKWLVALPRAMLSTRTWPLIEEALAQSKPEDELTEEQEQTLCAVAVRLVAQLNVERNDGRAKLLCQRFRTFFDEHIAELSESGMESVAPVLSFESTLPCVEELSSRVAAVIEQTTATEASV